MDDDRVARALARAVGTSMAGPDIADFLARLFGVCRDLLDVEAVGAMVTTRGGRLQLLAASSHRTADLEVHQSQIDEGPCVDAASESESVAVTGAVSLRARWPVFGPVMLDAGFQSVHSAPLRFEVSPVGAMALFRREADPFDEDDDRVAQTFADVVARAVMGAGPSAAADAYDRVERALSSRVAVERAKGVIAQVTGVDMPDAYDWLVQRSIDRYSTLTATADELLAMAAAGSTDLEQP